MLKRILSIIFVLVTAAACSGMHKGNIQPGSQADLEANVGDHVLFAFNSSAIDSEGNEVMARQVEWLKKYSNVNVIVEGRCDERGTREYNIALGERRANSAAQYLASAGISPDRIKTVSFGKERPVVLGSDEEAWRENRRATTVVN